MSAGALTVMFAVAAALFWLVGAYAPAAKPAAAKPPPPKHGERSGPASARTTAIVFAVGTLLFLFIGNNAPPAFMNHFTVFVLACFVGYMVVWNVTPALHTPLMSVTNAISGIILVGGMLQAGTGRTDLAVVLGGVAILFAAINVFGGFLVTQRMLQMFRK